jgi:predicted amidohydrolase
LERQSREAAARGAQLIVWPEAALWVDPRVHAEITPRLQRLAHEVQAYLLITWFIEDDPRGFRNESTFLAPRGTFAPDFYAKQHPIRFVGEQSFTRGPLPVFSLTFPGRHDPVRVSIMMGYDLAFPDTSLQLARRGAQLIVLGTHAWVEMSAIYTSMTSLRAAENGVAIAGADWRTGSAIAAPDGRLLAAAPTDRNAPAVLVADVPLPAVSGGPYTVVGDLPGWIALISSALILLWGHLRRS